MEYVKKDIPLWSITIWDKKFNNVEKEWQPKVRKYKYLLADELDSLKVENGDIRILYTGKDTGFTTEELAGDAIAEGEVVTIPWGGIPTVKYHKGKFVTGDNRIATSSDTSLLTNKYLYYYMKGNTQTLSSFYRGASLKHPSMKDVLKMSISFPSVEEQNKIVEQFDYLERLIELRQQELQKLDELVKARFVEMFGDININDKGWDVQPLGELCTIVRGGSPRPIEQFLGGDVPWIKIGDATDGDSIYLNSTKEHIIQAGVKKSRLVKAGSLIFANCGVSLGFARIITFDGCIHDGWLAMEDIDERLDKVFLLQALNQMTEHFRAIAPAGTQPNLNTAIMKAYMQILPPIEMQKEFIAFCKQLDKSKVAAQKALEEAQLLFDSLMQKYFG